MKHIISFAIAALFASSAFAQNQMPAMPDLSNMPPEMAAQVQNLMNMSEEEQRAFVRQMEAGAADMENCFNDAGGQAYIDEVEAKMKEVEGKLKLLCEAGKEDMAQQLAQRESKKMYDDPRAQKLISCSKDVVSKMPQSARSMVPDFEKLKNDTHENVCQDIMTKDNAGQE